MTTALVPVHHVTSTVSLTTDQFQTLAEIPSELEWFANLTNANTRLAYQQDIKGFMAYAGLHRPEQFREITRAHVIAWRQQLANDTIRRKLAALSSLYAYFCERHAVWHNPVLGVKRHRTLNREGVTPALGDHQARMLLGAPRTETLKGKRDRAILATLLYHGLMCEESHTLKVGDIQRRQSMPHLRIEGKEDKVRYLPAAPAALRLIDEYLKVFGHAGELHGPLFRPIKNNATKILAKPLSPTAVHQDIVKRYARETGIPAGVYGVCAHPLRARAANIAEVQKWLGHADISTMWVYDKRQSRLVHCHAEIFC